jgi:hypothetical protein
MAAKEVSFMTAASLEEASGWLNHLTRCAKSWPLEPDAEEIARSAEIAFDSVGKPEHFTDHAHCDECAEHDATLRGCSRATISRADFGRPGWSPISFCSAHGLMYYLPALMRYSLMPNVYGYEALADLVASAIGPDGQGKEMVSVANAMQRSVVVRFAQWLSDQGVDGADKTLGLWRSQI